MDKTNFMLVNLYIFLIDVHDVSIISINELTDLGLLVIENMMRFQ